MHVFGTCSVIVVCAALRNLHTADSCEEAKSVGFYVLRGMGKCKVPRTSGVGNCKHANQKKRSYRFPSIATVSLANHITGGSSMARHNIEECKKHCHRYIKRNKKNNSIITFE